MTWRVEHADDGSERLTELLASGWQPFAVTPEYRREDHEEDGRYMRHARVYVVWRRWRL